MRQRLVLCVILVGLFLTGCTTTARKVSDEELMQALHRELNKPEHWPMAVKLGPPDNHVVYTDDKPLERGLKVLLDSGMANSKNTRIVLSDKATPDIVLADPEMRAFLESQACKLPAPKTTTTATPVATITASATPRATETPNEQAAAIGQPTSKPWQVPPLLWKLSGATLLLLGSIAIGVFLKRQYDKRSERKAEWRELLDRIRGLPPQHQLLLRRVLLIAAIGTVISPWDLIPDFVPVIGWLDDLIAWLYLLKQFLELVARIRDNLSKTTATNQKVTTTSNQDMKSLTPPTEQGVTTTKLLDLNQQDYSGDDPEISTGPNAP